MISSNCHLKKSGNSSFTTRRHHCRPLLPSFLSLSQTLLVLVVTFILSIVVTNVESFSFSHPPYSNGNWSLGSTSLGHREQSKWSRGTSRGRRRRRIAGHGHVLLHLQPEHKQNMEELQRAARDPKAFEAYVLNRKRQQQQQTQTSTSAHEDSQSPSASNSDSPVNDNSNENKKKPSGYVPIEQWDEERKNNKDSMTWEERVQFDGLRNGNRFRQNEILRHHLRR